MRELKVYIELNGEQTLVGAITGEGYVDARFTYDDNYLTSSVAAPISISLPLQEESFSAEKTKNFFESLLPEGFSRKVVVNWMKIYYMRLQDMTEYCLMTR